jgi:hypothetical protein
MITGPTWLNNRQHSLPGLQKRNSFAGVSARMMRCSPGSAMRRHVLRQRSG